MEYRLNINTGCLVPVTPILDPKPYLVAYEPTDEEARIGRKLGKLPDPRLTAVEEAEAPEPAPTASVTEFVEAEEDPVGSTGLSFDAAAAGDEVAPPPRPRGRPRKR